MTRESIGQRLREMRGSAYWDLAKEGLFAVLYAIPPLLSAKLKLVEGKPTNVVFVVILGVFLLEVFAALLIRMRYMKPEHEVPSPGQSAPASGPKTVSKTSYNQLLTWFIGLALVLIVWTVFPFFRSADKVSTGGQATVSVALPSGYPIPIVNTNFEADYEKYQEADRMKFSMLGKGIMLFESNEFAYCTMFLSAARSEKNDANGECLCVSSGIYEASVLAQNPTQGGYLEFRRSLTNLVNEIREAKKGENKRGYSFFRTRVYLAEVVNNLRIIKGKLNPSEKGFVDTIIKQVEVFETSGDSKPGNPNP